MQSPIYFSSFIPGLAFPIKAFLNFDLGDIEILYLLDGAVIYRTSESESKIKKLSYCNNTFRVLHWFKSERELSFEAIITRLLGAKVEKEVFFTKRDFKVFFSNQNQFVTVNYLKRVVLETFIRRHYQLNFQKASRNYHEFWLLKRSERLFFFMLKLTGNKKKLQKGALRPELAYTLCRLSDPTAKDILLEPFAGSGAIATARLKFPFKSMEIIDNNKACIQFIKNKFKGLSIKKKSHVTFRLADFLHIAFSSPTFNKIITDPPWGMYSTIDNIPSFYQAIVHRFASILIEKGILILLVDRRIEIEKIVDLSKINLVCLVKHDILLSGTKASIYKMQKIGSLFDI